MKVFNSIAKLLKNTFKGHFNTKIRKLEFTFCVVSYFSLLISLMSDMVSRESMQVLGQIQSFIALYLAFRFRYLGMLLVVSSSFIEACALSVIYLKAPTVGLLAGLTSQIITIISCIIVAVLSNNQETHKLKLQEQKHQLHELSITDELTGVYNQRYFNSILDGCFKGDSNKYVGLILIDIDGFKMYNDVYGHNCGDSVLKSTGTVLKWLSKENTIVCRYGGDEFALVLPNSDLQSTKDTAHYIKNEFDKLKYDYYDNNLGSKVTLSIGLSAYPEMANSKNELMLQADMALYHSKNLGKNNINFYQDVILQLRKNISSDHQQLISIFKTLLSTISAKDKYTLGHSERVSAYAMMIGKAMNLSLKDISCLQYAGLLHDIGKIELPKSILNKVEKLSVEEFQLVKQHPVYSANILEPLEGMSQLIDFVIHHHEKFDGSGYPHGLSGKEISLGARILCVADSFDAMLSERVYSKGMPIEEAFLELKHCAGTHFDPDIVNIFISLMKDKYYSPAV